MTEAETPQNEPEDLDTTKAPELEAEPATPGAQEDGTYLCRLPNRNKVKIGDTLIQDVYVSEPDISGMKEDSLLRLNSGNINELRKVLPRCTSPMLTAPILNKMKLSDINQLAGAILYFMYASETDDGF